MTPESTASLKAKTVSSIKYKTASRFVIYGLQAVMTVILAQNLSAKDYGIVGFAMIFIGFLSRFNDIGVGSAVIQRPKLDNIVQDTAFTARVALGFVAFIVTWLAAPVAAASFGDKAVTQVIRVLSLGFLVGALGFIPSMLLLRNLEFRQWVMVTVTAAVLRTILACTMALFGYGYWSIVVPNLLSTIAESVGFMIVSERRSHLRLDFDVARELFRFGVPLFASGLLTFALFNADNFVVGVVAGATLLGYYALAFNWGSFLSSVIYEVFHSVLFPAFSRLQNDHILLRRTYLRIMEQLSVFGILIQFGLLVCAKDFLVAVLGKGQIRWLPATHALEILSIYGLVRLLVEPLGNLLVALGRTDLLFRACLLAATFEIVFLYPALKFGGIEGVAVLVTIAYGLQWIIYWPFVSRQLKVRFTDLRDVMLPSILASIPAFFGSSLIAHQFNVSLWSLALKAFVFSAIFIPIQGVVSSWRWLGDWKVLWAQRTGRCADVALAKPMGTLE